MNLSSKNSQSDPMLSLLDDMDCASNSDQEALHWLAQEAMRWGKFPAKGTFKVCRASLSAMLVFLKFDAWQMHDTIKIAAQTAGDHDDVLTIEEPTGSCLEDFKKSLDAKWLRMVDLGLESMGGRAQLVGPYSHAAIDYWHITMNANDLAYFLKCARYESWSEPDWIPSRPVVAGLAVVHSQVH